MPGAEPAEGFWDFPKPDDLPVANQAALTAYLAKQQKAGADFNAYRHGGTLLHHAIRAGDMRCIDCHDNVHPQALHRRKKAAGAEQKPAGEKTEHKAEGAK